MGNWPHCWQGGPEGGGGGSSPTCRDLPLQMTTPFFGWMSYPPSGVGWGQIRTSWTVLPPTQCQCCGNPRDSRPDVWTDVAATLGVSCWIRVCTAKISCAKPPSWKELLGLFNPRVHCCLTSNDQKRPFFLAGTPRNGLWGS